MVFGCVAYAEENSHSWRCLSRLESDPRIKQYKFEGISVVLISSRELALLFSHKIASRFFPFKQEILVLFPQFFRDK